MVKVKSTRFGQTMLSHHIYSGRGLINDNVFNV